MASKKDIQSNNIGGLLFVGSMFIGFGIGFYLNNIVVGGALGMGVGFLLMAANELHRNKKK